MKLLQRFILYTFIIICISIFIGFICSNLFYIAFVKEQMNNRYLAIAEQLAEQMEEHEITLQASSDFMRTMSDLGYQIVLVKEDGQMITFGEPFKTNELNEQMHALFEGEKVYHGVKSFKKSYLMMSHFANDIENTVGTKLELEGEEWALFLRSNNTSFFTEFHLVIFGFIFAVFVSSIIGILLMSRKLTQSLSELTSATQEIANHNYDYPLMINRKDEIGQLADSFRMMQQRLANTDKARKKFINNVSHDFQSPLLNIKGYSELLDRELSSSEGKKYNNIIQTEAKRLSNLTKQLLILTSIDQGTYPINKQLVRIDEQLHQVVYSMLWRIEEKGLEIKIDLQPVTVYADRSLLMNVWENLIGNAIKYNKEYGEISIECFEEKSEVIVKIKDTGIGIEEQALDKIFERFYRVDKARNREGMGLGLAIVQEVLSYHHASIQFESNVNEGTTFTIIFPKS
ncbi:HAMP domain-containing sensor histidine kinase [Bacillus sp. B15-48]|uniref:sensor histidine kinase n=1 Tax=Bacillus sp. B15-48 TaxID=1548601 RepID=UPI00193FA7B0|nr:HAMP domain-containing sensor histidine kinase [Bacillus sp. B15-48]MBM4761691.1 HAMP domain-containing protein [Bacillus sp. B15-48]